MRIGKEAEAELELVHQLYKLLPRKKQIKKIRVVAGALERIGATKKAFDQEVNIIQEKLHSRAPNDIFNAFIEACQNYAYYLRLLRRHLEKL